MELVLGWINYLTLPPTHPSVPVHPSTHPSTHLPVRVVFSRCLSNPALQVSVLPGTSIPCPPCPCCRCDEPISVLQTRPTSSSTLRCFYSLHRFLKPPLGHLASYQQAHLALGYGDIFSASLSSISRLASAFRIFLPSGSSLARSAAGRGC